MTTNLDRFKTDLIKLVEAGENLRNAIAYSSSSEAQKAAFKKELGARADVFLKGLPDFKEEY